MKTLEFNELSQLQGGQWWYEAASFVSGACAGYGAASAVTYAAFSVVLPGVGGAMVAGCLLAGGIAAYGSI